MKIASWNVNSLRVRLPHVLKWIEENSIDIIALQETKTQDENFPEDEIKKAGYHAVFQGQKTYNGVAIFSKKPPSEVVFEIKGTENFGKRIIAATINNVRVLNLYVINGAEVGSEKYNQKLKWLKAVKKFIEEDSKKYKDYLIMGDFNIAPGDPDVHDPAAWEGKILCSEKERKALKSILDLGFVDSFRLFEQEEKVFSWWDYRAGGFRRNHGLRIDLILASENAKSRCKSSIVDKTPRGWDRPSDHAPVCVEIK
ncbi:MAG: exodeoxyribonuclease III [Pseudomonadota bacterium]